ncbi:hypothetical protein B296_00024768 [Ensete ventricosum]|uniref:Uncharacterized protein n=1 Tax=Ensete ventricosum TaxID=4639 RepID=A0A426YHQ7_ENSVE|nr:hypothetical protein B296_00024768 [Ensete ventricosum]
MMNNTVVHRLLQVSSSSESEAEEEAVVEIEEQAPPPTWNAADGISTDLALGINKRRLLSKQLSMRETRMEAKWEKRRRQILQTRRLMEGGGRGEGGGDEEATEGSERRLGGRTRSLTDEDLDELRGSIDLGFGFNEEEGGQGLCDTLPALNLYFAVTRQLSDPKLQSSPSPASTPTATSSSSALDGLPSPRSPNEQSQSGASDSWKICNPGVCNPPPPPPPLYHLHAQPSAFTCRRHYQMVEILELETCIDGSDNN